ncbi:MAG: NAD(P)H-hydrate dehydratase [Candidatus Eremiobacteraeota bacterium]|nr:NAD(P)H-hydrate dehydratase [Candidatus Eremiobacteraeota bacterium]
MHVLTPEEMRQADAAACARVGEISLMRAAGRRIAALIPRYARSNRLIAFAGSGNNGGDAFAAFSELPSTFERLIYAWPSTSNSTARADAERRAAESGVVVLPFPRTLHEARSVIREAGIALDALLGTGAKLPLSAPYAVIAQALNECSVPVLAIDIPSGIDAHNGEIYEPVVRATATLAIGALKPGLILDPAREVVGQLWLGNIGIDEHPSKNNPPAFAALSNHEFLALLPARSPTGDKRSAGAPLIIAGSAQFPGAAILCAWAAARAGAGYVTVATPVKAAATLRAHLIEQVITEISEDCAPGEAVEDLLATARHACAVAIGPGLGLDERTGEIVRGFLQRTTLPFVADASALFHFARHREILSNPKCIITPHSGEFARLSGQGSLRDGERVARLRAFVKETGCATLLKGRTTLIDDGATIHLNTTGTSALATAGTGDVLTGIIATLLSAGLSPVDAGRAGAYWHGLAGNYAFAHRKVGIVAGDLPNLLAASLPDSRATRDDLQRVF